MGTRALAFEQHFELQIALDKLSDHEERCRKGLRQLVAGSMSREDYVKILSDQMRAQHDWAMNHHKYLGVVLDEVV